MSCATLLTADLGVIPRNKKLYYYMMLVYDCVQPMTVGPVTDRGQMASTSRQTAQHHAQCLKSLAVGTVDELHGRCCWTGTRTHAIIISLALSLRRLTVLPLPMLLLSRLEAMH